LIAKLLGYDPRMGSGENASPPTRDARDSIARVVATGLGSGYSPVAPGTAGSLVGLMLFVPLSLAPRPAQVVVTAVLFLVGVAAAARVARLVGRRLVRGVGTGPQDPKRRYFRSE